MAARGGEAVSRWVRARARGNLPLRGDGVVRKVDGKAIRAAATTAPAGTVTECQREGAWCMR